MTLSSTFPDARFHDRFRDLCHAPLPRGLRDEADGMSWDGFLAAYGDTAGPLSLDSWECTDTGRLGLQARTYHATLTVGDRIATSCASATGPIGALTAMLYDNGIALELLNFHQLQMGRDTVTFIRGTDGSADEWAMAWAEDATSSALRAVIACANRLSCR
ncbi:2-isopropylmalate synthase [Mycolicibacterium mengxianglii]|uniref:homocitrate synthase n=1 Tax=Mycolicibacterium mengxianglii TaxID=2736649 RepID=UPI0018EF0209|nr:homocitrate synthase [Mycolicibacterium mengxianglii]